MSASDPIAPDRLEALLRGEAGTDDSERRIGALLDELTVGEIAPPAELRERVRSLTTAPPEAAPAPRRRPGVRWRRPQLRLAPILGLAAVAAVIVGVVATQTRTPSTPLANPPHLTGVDQQRSAAPSRQTTRCVSIPQGTAGAAPPAKTASTAPLPDGQRAQDYAASLRLAVGSVAELSRSTQSVLDTVRSLGGAVVTVDYGTPTAGSGQAIIDLRVPVGRAQEALRRFSALGTITAQQVSIRDLQAGLDQQNNRVRALRNRIDLLEAKLLSPSLTPEERVTLENRLADSKSSLESVLRGVHATQQRAAFARFSLDLVTGRGTAIAVLPSQPGGFERTAEEALDVISVAGRGALFALIVGGPFVLLARRRLVALAEVQAPGCAAVARDFLTCRSTWSRQAPNAVPAPTAVTHASARYQATGAASCVPGTQCRRSRRYRRCRARWQRRPAARHLLPRVRSRACLPTHR